MLFNFFFVRREGTDLYSTLQEAVLGFAKSKGEYNTRRKAIEELYKDLENTDVDAEFVAELVGDYLFTDEKFVRNLSVNNRNLFQKIYDEIKYLCKVATAGSKEARQLEKVKKTFEQIYRESTQAEKNTTDESGVRYSFQNSNSGMANDVLSSYNEELSRFIEQRGDYIVDSYEKLVDIVDIAFNQPNKKATAYFGKIDVDTLERIKDSIPNLPKASKDVLFKKDKDYSVATTLDGIRHLVDEKSLSRKEILDFLDRFADTVVEFDSVMFNYYEKGKQKTPALLFKKNYPDGTVVSFNLISQNKRSLLLKTLYMDRVDYQKKKSAKTLLMQNANSNTSETQVGQTSNDIVPNSKKNVNKNSLSKSNSHPIKRGNYNVMGEEISFTAPIQMQSNDKSNDIGPVAKEGTINNKTPKNMGPVGATRANAESKVNLFVDNKKVTDAPVGERNSKKNVDDLFPFLDEESSSSLPENFTVIEDAPLKQSVSTEMLNIKKCCIAKHYATLIFIRLSNIEITICRCIFDTNSISMEIFR